MSADSTVPQPQSRRRIAILDIETIALDPSDPKGALDAMTGRIVCIGLLFEDGQRLEAQPIADLDEKKLLERFWATIRDTDLLVGHNILAFDLMFIRQRSWILGVKPPLTLNLKKYYTDQVVDLMALWTNWSNRITGASLENIAWALDCGEKTAHGADVAVMWANREYIRMMDYCMQDVWMAYRIYCRMHYREPLGAPMPALPPRPIETRELVTVPASNRIDTPAPAPTYFQPHIPQNHSPERIPSAISPAVPPAPAPARPSRPPRQRRQPRGEGNREIVYRAAGNSLVLVLSAATFQFKDTLKKVLEARGSKVSKPDESPARYEWTIAADKWESLYGLCQKSGITLVPAGNGRAA